MWQRRPRAGNQREQRERERKNKLENGNWKANAAIISWTNTECPLWASAVLGPGDRVGSCLGSWSSSEERWIISTGCAEIGRWDMLVSFLTAVHSFPLDARLSKRCYICKAFLLSTKVRKLNAVWLQVVKCPTQRFWILAKTVWNPCRPQLSSAICHYSGFP